MIPIIIMPTYNEVLNVTRMIEYLFKEVFKNSEVSILIIDSNSPDGTALKVEELQKEYKNLYLIKQIKKQGLASAYIEGFKWALKNNFDVFIQMDCDFQHPAELLPEMLTKLKDYELIIGSRYINGGSWNKNKDEKSSFLKKLTSNFGSLYAKTVLSCSINDLTGGFNIWSRKALTSIDLDKIISKGYLFQIEMKYKAFKNNIKITEYPITFNKRTQGKSKMDLKVILEAAILIWKIKKT